MAKLRMNKKYIFKILIGLFASIVVSAQVPKLNFKGIVHPDKEMAKAQFSEGKLWKIIYFKIDLSTSEVSLQSTGLISPVAQNEYESNLILEYFTRSGRTISVPAQTPWRTNSGAIIPTDEDGTGFRVYDSTGKLVGEYKDGSSKKKNMEAFELAIVDGNKLGFHDHGRHVVKEEKDKVNTLGFNPMPSCSLRWSWDGGKTWTDPKPVMGDDSITWQLTPDNMEKLKENPDPVIEVLVSAGLKTIRKVYPFRGLPQVKSQILSN